LLLSLRNFPSAAEKKKKSKMHFYQSKKNFLKRKKISGAYMYASKRERKVFPSKSVFFKTLSGTYNLT